ncbi:hydroxymethylglutaryl-CoA lyase [Hazenella sp. IB182357]|uniref:Hydroxymethylglutaryl-CoA lyase n=1 Tax=Polycladospora coralii TaxID=2771432 RepID=A0A926NCY4_9BACL|nr:hydroxymethylglutaryl-CoA lyase [Polycladospora coralii]MBD1371304.1 hydroxymethylglutaryl-CoA lyase [Polycladospora coralii]MBS7530272.1 hydroxymethylglutaryl-CoA lyase [Polycladospora coralii]
MKIKLVEVGLRDGLQNESVTLPTEVKKEIAVRLLHAGVKHLEVSSFVSPKWIPQLKDAEELFHLLPVRDDVTYRALVPNLKGLTRALMTPASEYAVFMSASESHNLKNINKNIADTLITIKEVVQLATEKGKPVRGYVSTVFGCPYEGNIAMSQVVHICEQLIEMGIYEISLGDTIGVATPKRVKEVIQSVRQSVPLHQLAGHFHDTRGMGVVNSYVAVEEGITTLDSAIGGLGGCPYAPGASGNVSTEDLVYLFDREGIETGLNLTELNETSLFLQEIFAKPLPSKVFQSYVAQKEA